MTNLMVLPKELCNTVLSLAMAAMVSEEDQQAVALFATLMDADKPAQHFEAGIHEGFAMMAPLVEVTDLTRCENGYYADPHTAKMFERYTDMIVRHGKPFLAESTASLSFFDAKKNPSDLKPQPVTAAAFERVVNLLRRLDPSMTVEHVIAYLDMFLDASPQSLVALVAAEEKWIEVEEGSPPEDCLILACNMTWPHALKGLREPPIKVGYVEAGAWKLFGGSWTPTHWRLLPALPHTRPKLNG